MRIRILIAENHPVLRATLRTLLDAEPDLEVVGEAEDLGEISCLAATLRPDIILLDTTLPDLQGFQVLRQLSCALPAVRVLLLTDSEESSLVRGALVAGAAGCVVGQAADSTLIAAVRAVSQGYIYIQPDLLRALLRDLRLPPAWSREDAEDLTPREVDVVRLIAQGYTNRQVAAELGLSVRTMETHRENVVVKLGVHSRAELVRYATAQRLVAAPK